MDEELLIKDEEEEKEEKEEQKNESFSSHISSVSVPRNFIYTLRERLEDNLGELVQYNVKNKSVRVIIFPEEHYKKPRHVQIVFGDEMTVYLCGGFAFCKSDKISGIMPLALLFKYHEGKDSFKEKENMIYATGGHCCAYSLNALLKPTLWAIGGTQLYKDNYNMVAIAMTNKNPTLNYTQLYDVISNTWNPGPIYGEQVCFASACTFKENYICYIYCFGGTTATNDYQKGSWIFRITDRIMRINTSTKNPHWERIEAKWDTPLEKSRLIQIGEDSILIFGGMKKIREGEESSNDSYIFSISEMSIEPKSKMKGEEFEVLLSCQPLIYKNSIYNMSERIVHCMNLDTFAWSSEELRTKKKCCCIIF